MSKRTTTRAAIVAAAATLGLGASAAGASAAYSISGGSYTGTATSVHQFSIGGAVFGCNSVTSSGTATGAASSSFTPSYSGCTMDAMGTVLPVTVTVNAQWTMTVTGGPVSGAYGVAFQVGAVSAGHSVVISLPDLACEFYVDPQPLPLTGGSANNFVTGTGVNLRASVSGISYTSAGPCPLAPSGDDMTYETGLNPVTMPGITIAGS